MMMNSTMGNLYRNIIRDEVQRAMCTVVRLVRTYFENKNLILCTSVLGVKEAWRVLK